MSLYVGNLSARTRRDDLERVFRRYGPCSVRIKDGYGFVVYENQRNAEIALRELCNIYNLSWSKKQPRQGRRFVRGGDRQHEGQLSRDFTLEREYVKQKLDSNNREYKMSVKKVNDGGGFRSDELFIKERAGYSSEFNGYDMQDDYDGKELRDQGDRVETGLVGNDRWDDQCHDWANNNGVESQVQFDRHEPYQGYGRKNDNEDYRRTGYSTGSPTHRVSRENAGRDHLSDVIVKSPGDVKFSGGCYACGGIGHKMHDCPRKSTSQRGFSRFDQRPEDDSNKRDKGKDELQQCQPSSTKKLQSSRDDYMLRRLKDDIKSFYTLKDKPFLRNDHSSVMKESDRYLGKERGEKKRNMKETVTRPRHKIKKSRIVSSSPLHSDYARSRSHSTFQSSKHVPRSHSNAKSRSLASKVYSSSSDSRSQKARYHSRPKSPKSRSRSSSPTSLSLSGSIGRPSPSSKSKFQLTQKGSSDDVESNVQSQEGVNSFEDANLEGQIKAFNENVPLSSNGRDEREDSLPKDDAFNLTALKSLDRLTNRSTDVTEDGNHTVDIICHEDVVETKEQQHTDASMMELAPNIVEKSDSEAPISAGHSARISPEELQMVLKNYGLDLPEENERRLPVDAYFGSARLWPWEVIYYRRLKKGPISVENYAKRIEQNRELGIIDKYIRSSSGWDVLDIKNS